MSNRRRWISGRKCIFVYEGRIFHGLSRLEDMELLFGQQLNNLHPSNPK